VIALLAIFSLVLIVLSRAADVNLDAFTPRILIIFTLVWHLLAMPVALLAMVLYGTTRAGAVLFGKHKELQAPSSNLPPTMETADSVFPTRRDFLAHVSAFAPVLVAAAGTGYSAATLSSLRIRELQVPVAGLPSALDGLSIAHVSDTHLGRFTDATMFRRIVSAVNDLDADLVLHTGDLINDDQSHLPMACQLLREMKSRNGLFLCEGNHDLIGGRESFEAFMRRERLPILIDEIAGVRINGESIEFLGLPWKRGGRTTGADEAIGQGVARLAQRRSSSAFPILLAHHPHAFDPAIENGIPLTLGGHTHGGQLQLTPTIGFGPAMYRYWSGLYSRDGRHTVISNGAGNWFPLRIGAPAEIARIILRRA
jgi:predicted MPP superfamily phosphohydrolase